MGHKKGTDEDGPQTLGELAAELGMTPAPEPPPGTKIVLGGQRPPSPPPSDDLPPLPEPDLHTGRWPPDAADPLPFWLRPRLVAAAAARPDRLLPEAPRPARLPHPPGGRR